MESNAALITLRPYIIEDVSYKHVSTHLVKKGLVTRNEDEEISNLTGKAKVTRLMDVICDRKGALEEFVYALRNPMVYTLYKNLILKLEYTIKNLNNNVSGNKINGTSSTEVNNNGSQNGSLLKSTIAHKIVEKRHFNELVKMLKNGSSEQWKQLYESLDIELCEMFSTSQKINKGMIDMAEAFRDVIDTWRENNGRKATFGILEDKLRTELKWIEAADAVCEYRWS